MFPLALLSPALFSNPSTLTETVVSDVYFFAFTSLLNKSLSFDTGSGSAFINCFYCTL
uniref:Uncharacterized protein n=1 Tax=Rhizophora mucronata TaxID=61149 RepID=A0A2P2JRM7_RHIMU